jgi:AraC-like DNA-binding protein
MSLTDFPIFPFIRHADYAVRQPWSIPERRILDYLLIYVQEGQCIFQVEGTDYPFRDGEFCLIQPNDLHSLQGISRTITPFAHLDIFYNPERERGFSTRPSQLDLSAYAHLIQPKLNDFNGIHIPIKLHPAEPILFRETLLKMIGFWKQRDIASQLEAQLLAMELIVQIYKSHCQTVSPSALVPQSLDWITSFLSFHLSEPITIEVMAQRANLSASRFSKVFSQCFGQSPHQYLMRLRTAHAQELLASTRLTLEQVAEYCGFADIHHFSRTFKKITGETPGKYRKQLTASVIQPAHFS